MSPHCALTEPSLSPHYRKGREGKGRGRENGVACDSMHRHYAEGRSASMHGLAPLGWWQR